MTQQLPTTRREAIDMGSKYYQGERPCNLGGYGKRRTSNSDCQCNLHHNNKAAYNKQYAADNKDDRSLYYKEWYLNNKEWCRQYKIDNIQRIKVMSDKWRVKNPNYFKQYYKNNKEHLAIKGSLWKLKNKERIRLCNIKLHKKNRVRNRQMAKQWRADNKAVVVAYTQSRRAAKEQATPTWYETDKVKRLFERCVELNNRYNIRLQVDHIIPLKSKTVCGLHCWANLQLLDQHLNGVKSNNYQTDW